VKVVEHQFTSKIFCACIKKNPPSLQGRKAAAIFSLKEMEALRYKKKPVSVDVQRKENEFNIFILLLVIYKNGCCVHLRLLTAVENNFAAKHHLNVMDCNRTVALIF